MTRWNGEVMSRVIVVKDGDKSLGGESCRRMEVVGVTKEGG